MSMEYLIDIDTTDDSIIDNAIDIAGQHVVVCEALREKDYTTLIVWADSVDEVIDAKEYIENTLNIKADIKDFYYNEAGVRLKLDKNNATQVNKRGAHGKEK